jgi:tryptophan synthase alpha chain
MPFLSAGDPSIAATGRIIQELDSAGAHMIEVGFPFSDPIADGPVIQASYTRALDRGLKVEDVFACVERLKVRAALLGMASYTLIHRRGLKDFVQRAVKAGFAGMIVPDLPAEEAGEFVEVSREYGLTTVLLVTPTTQPERAEKIVRLCSGFVYCVSVAGITGERDRLPDQLLVQLRQLRQMTDLPLCVGFGVSKPEHVKLLRDVADGVIVGSALVRRLESATDANLEVAIADIRKLAISLTTALNP